MIGDNTQLERKQVAKPQNEILGENRREAETGRTITKNQKVGRNDICPCGSGKKYKNCCGEN
jgi:preprotein translocase subunit SecA